MTRKQLLSFALLITVFDSFKAFSQEQQQQFTCCEVYQFAGTDSMHRTLVLKQTFTSTGQLSSETYTGFKENGSVSMGNGTYSYFYEDSLKVKQTFYDEEKDSTKIIFSYNDQRQLICSEFFSYERRMRKDVDKGYGRPGGCIVTEEDYEKDRSWLCESRIRYTYNDKGQRILYDATELHYTSQNKYTWEYDTDGRITQYASYDGDRLIWIKAYAYFDGGERYTQTWYDHEGTPKQLKEKWEYTPQYTVTSYEDDNGRTVKNVTITEKGETISTETSEYNAEGQLSRTAYYYRGSDIPDITHVYLYF